MSSIWDSFEVYKKGKHSPTAHMHGANHSNIGDTRTPIMYAAERHERRESVASEPSETEKGEEEKPGMVDISTLSQNEFKRLYDKTRKGEPNNRVNF